MLHLGISIAKIGFSLYSCENTVSWTKNFNKKIINNKINNKKRKGKKEEEHFPFFNLKTKNNSKIVLKKKNVKILKFKKSYLKIITIRKMYEIKIKI